jgi:hypothetical protein
MPRRKQPISGAPWLPLRRLSQLPRDATAVIERIALRRGMWSPPVRGDYSGMHFGRGRQLRPLQRRGDDAARPQTAKPYGRGWQLSIDPAYLSRDAPPSG